MAENRGKQFEQVIKEAFEKVDGVSIDRLQDPTAGFAGIKNICDFIVYKKPHQYYIECKAIHGNTLNFQSHITANQWQGLLEKSKIEGVKAGVICWYTDHDITVFLPIKTLESMKTTAFFKSCNVGIICTDWKYTVIQGKKKRIFFDYNMNQFFKDVN